MDYGEQLGCVELMVVVQPWLHLKPQPSWQRHCERARLVHSKHAQHEKATSSASHTWMLMLVRLLGLLKVLVEPAIPFRAQEKTRPFPIDHLNMDSDEKTQATQLQAQGQAMQRSAHHMDEHIILQFQRLRSVGIRQYTTPTHQALAGSRDAAHRLRSNTAQHITPHSHHTNLDRHAL